MSKRITILITIVCAITLSVFLLNEKRKEDEIQYLSNEMESKTRNLYQQIHSLNYEIDDLEKEASLAKACIATFQFIVTDLNTNTYEKIVIPMLDYEYPIGLGVSLTTLPGMEGYVTNDEANTLLQKNCYFVFSFNKNEVNEIDADSKEEALGIWLDEVTNAVVNQGYTIQNAIYFPSGLYDSDYIDVLKTYGIHVVIHHGEENKNLLTADYEDNLWYVGSAWWIQNNILNGKLSEIASSGGELVTVMGINTSSATTLDGWMGQFVSTITGLELEVTDINGMVQVQTENDQIGPDIASDTEEKIMSIENEIAELEKQIAEIEDEYMEQIRSIEK